MEYKELTEQIIGCAAERGVEIKRKVRELN